MFLNHRMRLLLGVGAVTVLMGMQNHAQALTGTLEVSATVPDACTLDSGVLEFGTYNSGQANTKDATGGFNVQCTSASDVHITLDGGLNPHAGNNGRAMSSSSTNDVLDYDLYKGTGISTPWPENTTIPYTLIAGANPITIFGLIPGSQTIAGGDYSDTVQITLTFD